MAGEHNVSKVDRAIAIIQLQKFIPDQDLVYEAQSILDDELSRFNELELYRKCDLFLDTEQFLEPIELEKYFVSIMENLKYVIGEPSNVERLGTKGVFHRYNRFQKILLINELIKVIPFCPQNQDQFVDLIYHIYNLEIWPSEPTLLIKLSEYANIETSKFLIKIAKDESIQINDGVSLANAILSLKHHSDETNMAEIARKSFELCLHSVSIEDPMLLVDGIAKLLDGKERLRLLELMKICRDDDQKIELIKGLEPYVDRDWAGEGFGIINNHFEYNCYLVESILVFFPHLSEDNKHAVLQFMWDYLVSVLESDRETHGTYRLGYIGWPQSIIKSIGPYFSQKQIQALIYILSNSFSYLTQVATLGN